MTTGQFALCEEEQGVFLFVSFNQTKKMKDSWFSLKIKAFNRKIGIIISCGLGLKSHVALPSMSVGLYNAYLVK